MPKRTDIKSILILGSGPIVIGQACEFDYSGVQACKALREEGYRLILVNSNPATIMTDPDIADVTYIETIDWKIVRRIIKKDRPNALLPTMGGQTALNCALDLDKHGVLEEFSVEMIGATAKSINKAEDRACFYNAMKSIGLDSPYSDIARTMDEADRIVEIIGFPCIIRPSFTMGGSGGGIAYNKQEFNDICCRGFSLSSKHELLIDESLIGWKEYEMEVVRDKSDNCIIVCAIENIDPMGIHTGDSITVAPAQTLTDKEYQFMRNASISVLREVGIETGGSNVQFAIHPKNGRMVIIEMNPRVSRSSALASKATGFPIAKIAAKLAVGFTLDELMNDITGGIVPASFEPTIDYVVTKIPRFNFEKFIGTNDRLTTQMKSIGEVMAIGRNQQESLQKALRGLEVGVTGFDEIVNLNDPEALIKICYELKQASSKRIWYIADAFRAKMSIDKVYHLTQIDRWFLMQIEELIVLEEKIKIIGFSGFNKENLTQMKRKGFSDARLSKLVGVTEKDVRSLRNQYDIHPVYKRVDTCAAEFSTKTAYMYSSYDDECESDPTDKEKVMILGGGPNRIGQGIEFDYCCVHASLGLREDGYETIMVNCNPETVSTDYDTSDRLYFEPITLEDILSIVRIEKPKGIIIQYGGQTPLKLARSLEEVGIQILGTSPDSIDYAEDREHFKLVVNHLGLLQPKNATINTIKEAIEQSKEIGFPLVVRPSYVLGGRAMEIVYDKQDLCRYFKEAVSLSSQLPVLLDAFLDDAVELDVDLICDGKHVVIAGIMEHIEQAGIHSGDSACSLPAYTLSQEIQDIIRKQAKKLAFELNILGLMNIQFAVKKNEVYLIEVNPRAARTIPFVSKAIGVPIAKIAARVMLGQSLKSQNFTKEIIPSHYSVKAVVFPFNKFPNVDPLLGPEMRSTGEVMGIGKIFNEAYAKAELSCGNVYSNKGIKRALLSVCKGDKGRIADLALKLEKIGYELDATYGTAIVLREAGMNPRIVNKVHEGHPHVLDRIQNNEYTYIVNTVSGRQAIKDSKILRRAALTEKVNYATTLNAAFATCMAHSASNYSNLLISIQELHKK
ncbi:carbamoyl-phosphate synthase large chain [Candidatus Photodesmus katoptron]|uniref:carbamoyl-phosphate synthase large subunit n=1 Tax=Candidatus Photodesmus anomalopis TaxID=28176 RepID=UPI0004D54B8B|nr:carbamoyl-phosphate synthase large subunit [Candidatus Photodesmus katoptron]KEY90567.1 carbamoyl-phosphate synthase large chain [Candidatus Photodesmus katoptron]